jgi:DNA-directed RNA polymerase subunit RPC12/RpoP
MCTCLTNNSVIALCAECSAMLMPGVKRFTYGNQYFLCVYCQSKLLPKQDGFVEYADHSVNGDSDSVKDICADIVEWGFQKFGHRVLFGHNNTTVHTYADVAILVRTCMTLLEPIADGSSVVLIGDSSTVDCE